VADKFSYGFSPKSQSISNPLTEVNGKGYFPNHQDPANFYSLLPALADGLVDKCSIGFSYDNLG